MSAIPAGIAAAAPIWNGADLVALFDIALFLWAVWPLIPHQENPMTLDQARERMSEANARVIRAEASGDAVELNRAKAAQARAAAALVTAEREG